MIKKEYKFTNKKQSLYGMGSTLIGVIAVALLVYGIYISFTHEGAAGAEIGTLGLTAFIISIPGLILGLRGFKDDDSFYAFCWSGSICNMAVLVFTLCMILIGF